MSTLGSSRSRKVDPLAKKPPSNPKYRDVQAVVDTGSSMSKYLKKIEEIRTNYKYKPNELFKRMKMTTFVQLIIQVSSVDGNFLFDDEEESIRPDTGNTEINNLTDRSNGDHLSEQGEPDDSLATGRETARSTLQGLISGVGEFDVNQSENKEDPPDSSRAVVTLADRPFLLLDVRDKDEFEQCHIITAENFPIATLSRSCNYESKSMLAFKNQPGKIILLYDEDERIAPKAATTLVERGYDNLYMLSGGLKVAFKLYPQGLITGTPPASIVKTQTVEKANQDNFTRENVFALLDQTETAVSRSMDSRQSSRAGSLASRQSTKPPGTARSAMSTVSTGTAIHRKPFR